MNARHILHRDIESRSTVDLTEVGAWRYADDPNTGVWCVAYAVNDAPTQIWIPGQPVPEEFHVAARDPSWLISAHNDGFERAIEELILAPRYGWPIVPIQQHVCTMAMVLASALPGSLDGAAEVLNSPFRKDVEGQRLMRKMARPRKPRAGEDPNGLYWHDEPENQTHLQKYCALDTDAERWLYQRVSPLTDSEQALWALDATINRRGFHTDGVLLKAASQIAAAAGQAVQEELASITIGALTSTDQVAALLAWLAEHGCEMKNLQKPTLKHALRRKELDPVVRRVIELRLGAAHAAAAKVDALLAWRNTDGRVRGTLRFHGAGTGRWTGHGPQPQNFRRDSGGIEEKIAAIATGDLTHVAGLYPAPLEAVGDIARAMICAAPGNRLLIGDFSGIESRVLAWVSSQQSKLEQWAKFDRTGDPKDEPYYLLGRSCGRPETAARSIGKTADLAFGYMGGPGTWDRLAPDDDTSTEADKRRYQKTWRSLHPHTVQFWAGINRATIDAVRKPGTTFSCRCRTIDYDGESFLRITLPSGRSLSYPAPRLATDKFGNAMVIFKDNAAGKWVDCRYGQGAYGGLWTENIVQAISRDLLAGAMQRLEAAGYPIVLHVHDEIVAEAPIGFGSLEEFQRLITTLPEWAEGLPIAAKVRNGQRFSKSQKPSACNSGTKIPDDLSIPDFLMRHPAPFTVTDEKTPQAATQIYSGNSGTWGYSGKRECPFHKDPTPSLHLYPDGHYHCFGCGAHGDIEELPETVQTSAPSAAHSNTDTLKLGIQLWHVAVSIRGTLAEQYLRETRKLDLASLPDIDATLRFHPKCPFDGNSHPCLLALFRDVETDESAGIHRIALTANAEKIGRMMLGSWPRPRAIKLRAGNDQLIAGEGIETVIAGAIRRADTTSALWAMGSANAIGKLPLIAGFAGLTILVDREASNIGLDNARACTERWCRASRKAGLAVPHAAKADFNDLIKGKAP